VEVEYLGGNVVFHERACDPGDRAALLQLTLDFKSVTLGLEDFTPPAKAHIRCHPSPVVLSSDTERPVSDIGKLQ